MIRLRALLRWVSMGAIVLSACRQETSPSRASHMLSDSGMAADTAGIDLTIPRPMEVEPSIATPSSAVASAALADLDSARVPDTLAGRAQPMPDEPRATNARRP